MIPKQRNHPNIVNKLIGKSSLKSKNRLMKISPNPHTNLAVLLQQKNCCCRFSAPGKITPARLCFLLSRKTLHGCSVFCSPEKTPPGCSVFAHWKNTPARLTLSQKNSRTRKNSSGCSCVFPLKHKALMGLSENNRNWAAKKLLGWTHFTPLYHTIQYLR